MLIFMSFTTPEVQGRQLRPCLSVEKQSLGNGRVHEYSNICNIFNEQGQKNRRNGKILKQLFISYEYTSNPI